jgi:hypothetical protein
MTLHVPALALAITFILTGCSRTKEQAAPAPSASASASAAVAAVSASGGDDEVGPVYPVTNAPPDPLAQKLCEAIHVLPAARKAACCSRPPGATVAGECARMLSFALREKSVTLDPAAVDRCSEAVARIHEGCGWVGPLLPPSPPECDGIVIGTLPQGKPCRSSLECLDGLRCQGAGPTDRGVCAPPGGRGRACGIAVDTLAAHARQSSSETKHPECQGFCAHRLCTATVPTGGRCTSHVECGAGRACVDKTCSDAPLPAVGSACKAGLCAGDGRCVKGQCIAPKAEGEACESDRECRGACERPDGGVAGKCGKRCGWL